jgi:hypothetical protein
MFLFRAIIILGSQFQIQIEYTLLNKSIRNVFSKKYKIAKKGPINIEAFLAISYMKDFVFFYLVYILALFLYPVPVLLYQSGYNIPPEFAHSKKCKYASAIFTPSAG